MTKINTEINEIWVHATCTTWPQEDTVWFMFTYQPDGGAIQYSPAIRYEITMRVKRKPQEPYRRVNGWNFDINNDIGGRYGIIMVNKAQAEGIEAHMKDLFQKFDSSSVATFEASGAPTASHPALNLGKIVLSNLVKFNPVGLATQAGELLLQTYFQNKDAPIVYDRVYRAAGQHTARERYARDYIGVKSRYGVGWWIGEQ